MRIGERFLIQMVLFRNRIISSEELIEQIEAVNVKNLKDLMQDILTKSQPTVTIFGKIDKDVRSFEKIKDIVKK